MKLVDKALRIIAGSSDKTVRSIGSGGCKWAWSYLPQMPAALAKERKAALSEKTQSQ